jgi:hypothetical protein
MLRWQPSHTTTCATNVRTLAGPVKFAGFSVQPPLTKAQKAERRGNKVLTTDTDGGCGSGSDWRDSDCDSGCGAGSSSECAAQCAGGGYHPGARIKASQKSVKRYMRSHGWGQPVRSKNHWVYKRLVAVGRDTERTQTHTMPCSPSDVRVWRNQLADLRSREDAKAAIEAT